MFLRQYGYQVADGKNFYSEALNEKIDIKRSIDDGWDYAREL